MSAVRSTRGRLGGLGAIFFLGTLGAIALYVQRQTVPEDRDLTRKAATVLPEVVPEDKPLALPWEDRLALSEATLVPVSGASAPKPVSAEGASANPDKAIPNPAEAARVDPEHARYVQDLSDGHRILLTLDPVLQESALKIFRNREVPYAAAVMLDLKDNSVLALAGHSSMDPGVDPLEVVATPWAPAASTFKLVTAAALLDGGATTPSTKVCFHGGLHGIKDDELRDDPAVDTRCETLSSAIAHSHNLVIGKLALRNLGQTQLAEIARKLYFETEIPFEFDVETSKAHIPADPIERAKVAAGFWQVDMSPVHGALLASIWARSGMMQPPHIIDQVIAPDGTDLTPARPKPRRAIGREVADAVGVMMRGTTKEGTARSSFRDRQGNPYIQGVDVAGKTGSLTGKRPPALNYNWFIGYAPVDRPEIAFAVLLANEPKWRIKAHYAARRLVQIYLERRDEIVRQRDAKLTPTGVAVPQRHASGALVKERRPADGADKSKPKSDGKPTTGAKGKPPAKSATPANAASDPPLPPVPGPLPPPPG